MLPLHTSLISVPKSLLLSLFLTALCLTESRIGWADIYVSNLNGSTANVYPDGAQGDQAPIRMLQGPDTELNLPAGIALDLVHGEFFLVPQVTVPKVNVYPLHADGNQPPIRTIDGPNTGIDSPAGVAVDPINDELYVASYANASIRVFSRTASGDVPPIRVIQGPDTGLVGVSGIYVDLKHDEIFVTNFENLGGTNTVGSVRVFPRTAEGNASPIRSLDGPSVSLTVPQWVFVSQQHDELYVSDQAGLVNVYNRTAAGDVAPNRSIIGPNTGLSVPLGILLTAEDELVLANAGGNSVSFFPRLTDGDVAPSRIIAGDATGLSGPYTVASTIAADGAVGFAGPLCLPNMGLACPPHEDPQSFVTGNGLDVQINGGVSAPEPCEPIARIHWDWGDGTSTNSGFPATHHYSEISDYTITTSAFDAGDNLIASASCDISLQIIFFGSFEP